MANFLTMREAAIPVLKANVTQQDALRAFSSRGLSALYWSLRSGPLQRIAGAYVPFWLYRVGYRLNPTPVQRWFALDAVKGALDLFEFPKPPASDAIDTIETRNFLTPALSEAEGTDRVRDKVLRVVFQQGFFKLRSPQIEIERQPDVLYMPYWLGFYGGRGAVHCRVLDAVRRRVEGAKASAFFEQWLAA
jgi:hypothetical protein